MAKTVTAKTVTLQLTAGRPTGSRSSRRLRNDDHVPAVLYGQNFEPVAVTVERRDLRAALTTDAGLNAVLSLHLGEREQLALVRDLQQDPVKKRVLHVDFLAVDPDQKLLVDVPVLTEGEAEKVHNVEGGTIDQVLHRLSVLAKPHEIPNDITVDVSEMDIGDTIRVQDLVLPGDVTADADPEEAVVVAKIVVIEVPEPEEELEEELLEGEEGELLEGEEAAAEGEEGAAEGEGDEGADEG